MKRKPAPLEIRIDHLGPDLKHAREANKFAVLEVETNCGIPTGQLERFEAGEARPGLAQLRRLAASYGVSIVTSGEQICEPA